MDSALVEQAKRYAARNRSSLSQLIEVYFKSLTRPAHKKTAIDLLKELPKPKKLVIDNIKEDYFSRRKNKYGF